MSFPVEKTGEQFGDGIIDGAGAPLIMVFARGVGVVADVVGVALNDFKLGSVSVSVIHSVDLAVEVDKNVIMLMGKYNVTDGIEVSGRPPYKSQAVLQGVQKKVMNEQGCPALLAQRYVPRKHQSRPSSFEKSYYLDESTISLPSADLSPDS